MKFRYHLASILIAFTPVLVAAQSSPAEVADAHGPQLTERAPHYRIHPGDELEINFALSPEFNQAVSVLPDGYIGLKSVGLISAADSTIPELTKKIQSAYIGILRDPSITIVPKNLDKPYFIASGEVGKPGKYDLRNDTSLTEAVAIAGGFTEASKHSQVVVFHRVDKGQVSAQVIDVKKMLQARKLDKDPHLQPGDMIFVPKNRISKIQRYLPTSSLGLYGFPSNL
jgi:polysaccharide export outer membrane protein